MNRFSKLSIYSLILFIVIFVASKSLLHSWIYFNIFISLYEMYIILTRKKLNKNNCSDGFWNEEDDGVLFHKAWQEYACKTDERYFDKSNYVFIFEFINVVLTLLMLVNMKYVRPLLLLQLLNCSVYFTTLTSDNNTYLGHTYRAISALWLVVPAILLYRL